VQGESLSGSGVRFECAYCVTPLPPATPRCPRCGREL
jgi:hypothetical protein